MAQKLIDLLKAVRPLNSEELRNIEFLSENVDNNLLKQAKTFLRQRKISLYVTKLGVSDFLVNDQEFMQAHSAVEEGEVVKFVENLNREVIDTFKIRKFKGFAPKAHRVIPELIASHIVGCDMIREAIMLQLFSQDPIHILLVGDPGTGKTDFLRSAYDLHRISSYGLGSGISKAGLSMSMQGQEVIKGLLPLADKGICCIDELNLMQNKDRAALLNAMEKGFIAYDKANKHKKLQARIRLLATANPKGNRFVGKTPSILKQQIDFDSALLTRFHLMFLIKKPDAKEFRQITESIVLTKQPVIKKADVDFIADYVAYAEDLEVEIPLEYKKHVVEFVQRLKNKEKSFIMEITPRLVIGIIRMARASARMNLRSKVAIDDVERVKEIITAALFVYKK